MRKLLNFRMGVFLSSSFSLFLLFQNFTPSSLPHEAAYSTGQGIPLSQLEEATPGPDKNKVLEIHPGEVAYLDKNIEVSDLIINGQLHCDPSLRDTLEIKARTIYVNGVFQCGTSAQRFEGHLTISLKDRTDVTPVESPAYRGLIVNSGGTLVLTGSITKSRWLRLGATTYPGDEFITLEDFTANSWQVGDEIALAPSSFRSSEAENFVITKIDFSLRRVYLNKPAKFLHWGLIENLVTSNGKKIRLDQRAEVANLTRNILVKPDESLAKISDTDQIGAHIMVNRGGFAALDAVELYRMGQAGIMARYPFHWHVVGDAPGQFIKNSSIHASFQRCITIHKTNKTLVENNVCYDFRGHGFFLEDGNEVDNVLRGNIGILAKTPSPNKILLSSDNPDGNKSGVVVTRFPATATFWISHPKNTVVNNVAAGSAGTGFWMAFAPAIRKFNSTTQKFEGDILTTPINVDTTEFSNNIAHSTLVGINWDGVPNFAGPSAGNPRNPQDRRLVTVHYSPKTIPTFKNLVVYKNLYTGIYFRGQTALFENALLADNGWSLFFAYNQIVRNSTVIARSSNYSATDEQQLYTNRAFLKKSAGIVLYDGPFELDHVDFVNFDAKKVFKNSNGVSVDVTSVPFFTIAGNRKYTNQVKNLTFTPNPYYRLYSGSMTNTGSIDTGTTSTLRDIDGSLTGVSGSLLTPDSHISSSKDCVRHSLPGSPEAFYGYQLCRSHFRNAGLFFNSNNISKIPFVSYRSDGAYFPLKNDWQRLDDVVEKNTPFFNNKINLVTSEDYAYALYFRKKDLGWEGLQNLKVNLNSDLPQGDRSPIVRLVGLGSACSLSGKGVQQVTSIAALKASAENSYYSNKNDFVIKLKTTRPTTLINPTSNGLAQDQTSEIFSIKCAQPMIPKIVGNIDSVFRKDKTLYVAGWACEYGQETSVDVHMYAGGPAGHGGVFAKHAKTSQATEPGVYFACGTLENTHRFLFAFNENEQRKWAGKPIYIHGISQAGTANLIINKSGSFSFPK